MVITCRDPLSAGLQCALEDPVVRWIFLYDLYFNQGLNENAMPLYIGDERRRLLSRNLQLGVFENSPQLV